MAAAATHGASRDGLTGVAYANGLLIEAPRIMAGGSVTAPPNGPSSAV